MRIHRHMIENHRDYCVQFEVEPVSWTEVPVTAKVLRNQHKRWHRGLWETLRETLWEYRRMLFNPRYGRVELVVVVLGFALGVVNSPYALMFLAVACGYAILVNPGRQGRRGADLPQAHPLARPGGDPAGLGAGERRLPSGDGMVAPGRVAGESARQETGRGDHASAGLRRRVPCCDPSERR